MRALKIDHFLSAEAGFQPVIAKALEIEALAKSCQRFLPPDLARVTRVANLKDGKLVMLSANGPAAAKLKLLAESLVHYLSEQGAKVSSVSVRVQPGTRQGADAAMQKRARLQPGALSELAALHARLRDSPLRKALKNLLENHEPTPSRAAARRTADQE